MLDVESVAADRGWPMAPIDVDGGAGAGSADAVQPLAGAMGEGGASSLPWAVAPAVPCFTPLLLLAAVVTALTLPWRLVSLSTDARLSTAASEVGVVVRFLLELF